MSRVEKFSRELVDLMLAAADGSASADDLSKLESALSSDAEAARLFLNLCQLEADLRLHEAAEVSARQFIDSVGMYPPDLGGGAGDDGGSGGKCLGEEGIGEHPNGSSFWSFYLGVAGGFRMARRLLGQFIRLALRPTPMGLTVAVFFILGMQIVFGSWKTLDRAPKGRSLPGTAFWSFNEGSPDVLSSGKYPNRHVFSSPDEHGLASPPRLHINGTYVISGIAVGLPDYTSTSESVWSHGRSVQWQRGRATTGYPDRNSTGNSFTIEFDSRGFHHFQLRFDYRLTNHPSLTDWRFTSIEYSLDGETFLPTGVEPPMLRYGGRWHEVAFDFSSLTAIENQGRVFLRFNLPDLAADLTSFRFDNVELTSNTLRIARSGHSLRWRS